MSTDLTARLPLETITTTLQELHESKAEIEKRLGDWRPDRPGPEDLCCAAHHRHFEAHEQERFDMLGQLRRVTAAIATFEAARQVRQGAPGEPNHAPEAASAVAAWVDISQAEAAADELYASHTGRGPSSRRTSLYADQWLRRTVRVLAAARIGVLRYENP